jgi:hypothetical protein
MRLAASIVTTDPQRGIVLIENSANQVQRVRGLHNPDQSYSRTSLVRMLPIGVGGDG